MKNKTYLIILNGLPGTGKSHLARYLAKRNDLVHLSSDEEREKIMGNEDPGLKYHAAVTAFVFKVLVLKAEVSLLKGQGVIIDALNNYPPAWESYIELGRDNGAECVFIDNFDSEEKTLALLNDAADRHFSEASVDTYQKVKEANLPYATANKRINEQAATFSVLRDKGEILPGGIMADRLTNLNNQLHTYLGDTHTN